MDSLNFDDFNFDDDLRSVVTDDVKEGLKIEIEEICDIQSGSYSILEVISIPSRNRILVFRNTSIFILNTDPMKLVREIKITGNRITDIEQLNSEIFILCQKLWTTIQFHSVNDILDGKYELSNSINSMDKMYAKQMLARVDDDTFLIIPYKFNLFLEEEDDDDLENKDTCLFSYSKMKIIDKFSFEKKKVLIEGNNIIKPSPKFIGCLYISVGGVFSDAKTNHIALFNLENKKIQKKIDLVDIATVIEFSFLERNNEELVVAVGSPGLGSYGSGGVDTSLATVFNFSKKEPIVEKRIGISDENYKNLVKSNIGIYCSSILCGQVLFLGESSSGSLVATNLTTYEKYFSKIVSEENIDFQKIRILSYSKNTISVAAIGKSEIFEVKIVGIELDLSKVKNQGFVVEDEKERINFLLNSQDLYFFTVENKSFIEFKLSNKIIENVPRILV